MSAAKVLECYRTSSRALLGPHEAGELPKGIKAYAIVCLADDGEVVYGANFHVSEREGQEMATTLRYMAQDISKTTKGDRFS